MSEATVAADTDPQRHQRVLEHQYGAWMQARQHAQTAGELALGAAAAHLRAARAAAGLSVSALASRALLSASTVHDLEQGSPWCARAIGPEEYERLVRALRPTATPEAGR